MLFHLELLESRCLLSASSLSPGSPGRQERWMVQVARAVTPHSAQALHICTHTHTHTHTRTTHTHTHTARACQLLSSVPLPPSVFMPLSLALFFSPPYARLPKYCSFLILFYRPCHLSPSLYLCVSQSLVFCFSLAFVSLYILVSFFVYLFSLQGHFHPNISIF